MGVRASTPDAVDLDDAPRPLGAILDDGRLPRGAASVVAGSTSLLLALLATSQSTSDWLAVVGAPDLGMLAATDAGVALERVALVPRAGDDPAGVVAALLGRHDVRRRRARRPAHGGGAPAAARPGARARFWASDRRHMGARRGAPRRRRAPVDGHRCRRRLPPALRARRRPDGPRRHGPVEAHALNSGRTLGRPRRGTGATSRPGAAHTAAPGRVKLRPARRRRKAEGHNGPYMI